MSNKWIMGIMGVEMFITVLCDGGAYYMENLLMNVLWN